MTPDEFVQRLLNHIGPPDHATDLKTFKADYVAALGGAEPDILREASERLLKARTYRAWPMVGECVEAVGAVAGERERKRQRESRGGTSPYATNNATPEMRQRVAALVKATVAEMAEKAAHRGNKPILYALYEEIHGRPWREPT
jgi:hypothetical protein